MEVDNVVKQILELLLKEQEQARKILALTQDKKVKCTEQEQQTFLNTISVVSVQIDNLKAKIKRLKERDYQTMHDELVQTILNDMQKIKKAEPKVNNKLWYKEITKC